MFYAMLFLGPSAKNSLISFFENLFHNPQDFGKAFLPGMPHDLFYEQYKLMAETNGQRKSIGVYECPNGHRYFIGDCTIASYVGKCPCGAGIGGTNHRLDSKNKNIAKVNDETKTGYCQKHLNKTIETIRTLSPLVGTLLQLFIDTTLYLSLVTQPGNFKNLLTLFTNGIKYENDLKTFLEKQIDSAFKFLDIIIKQGRDNTYYTVFVILYNLKLNANMIDIKDALFNQRETRNTYESNFDQFISKLNYGNYEKYGEDIDRDMKENNPDLLINTILKCNLEDRDNSGKWYFDEPKYWIPKVDVSFANMINNLKMQDNHIKSQFEPLVNICEDMERLRIIEYLPKIVDMIFLLSEKFNNEFSMGNVKRTSVQDLFKNKKLDKKHDKNIIKEGCKAFIDACHKAKDSFNTLIVKLIDVKLEILNEQNFERLPISVLFPSALDDGLCICVLIEFLIKLQNDALFKYKNKSKSAYVNENEIPLKDLNMKNIITVPTDDEMNKLVYLNSNYLFTDPLRNQIEYDFDKIQVDLFEIVFSNKPLIDIKVKKKTKKNLLLFPFFLKIT